MAGPLGIEYTLYRPPVFGGYTELQKMRDGNLDAYQHVQTEVADQTDALFWKLGHIFAQRGAGRWKAEEHMPTTITHSVVAAEGTTTTFKGTEVAKLEEKDYAITLLVDLSASMNGESMQETFKGVVAMAESLEQLGISTEILGFNDKIYEYKTFDEPLTDDVRARLGSMPERVHLDGAGYNDDGWALTLAAERLGKREELVKALIVFSDGQPVESPRHSAYQYGLRDCIASLASNPATSDQILVGLGLGSGTTYVKDYYAKAYVAGIPFDQMVEQFSGVLADVLNSPQTLVQGVN